MEQVDWINEEPEHYEYLRSRQGRLVPPEPHLTNVVGSGLFHIAEEVARAIIVTASTNFHSRPEGYVTPDHLAEDMLGIPRDSYGDDPRWMAVMSVGLWLAKHDPEYWGIDPDTESYCSACRKVRPLDNFTHHEARCDRHY